LLCCASLLIAQNDSRDADRKQIIDLERQMVQMDLKGSYTPEFIRDHVGDDMTFVWPMGFGSRDEFVKPDTPPLDETIGDFKVKFYGSTAVVNGTWHKKDKDRSDPAKTAEFGGFLVHVWAKQDGKWKLVSSAAGPLMGH